MLQPAWAIKCYCHLGFDAYHWWSQSKWDTVILWNVFPKTLISFQSSIIHLHGLVLSGMAKFCPLKMKTLLLPAWYSICVAFPRWFHFNYYLWVNSETTRKVLVPCHFILADSKCQSDHRIYSLNVVDVLVRAIPMYENV